MHSTHIRFLKNNQVNKQRWDDCIDHCPNGLIYAKSIYLDCMCPGWNALIHEDYDWVMPLTSRSKFGISYLYQPPFTQQLGVFAKDKSVNIPWQEILKMIGKKFKYWQYNFNFGTPAIFDESFVVKPATNFVLHLKPGYDIIQLSYARDLFRNLEKSSRQRLHYSLATDPALAIEMYKGLYGDRMPHVTQTDYNRCKKLISLLQNEHKIVCRQVVNDQQEMLAIALLLQNKNRLYNLMNSTTEAGRKTAANHFLMDSIIREFAGQDLILDFEGSDLAGVKAFYQNFGAANQPFYMVTYNQLPWPINLLKR